MLAELDAALRRRSTVVWVAFRIVAGLLLALGLFVWIGLWFERNFWAGLAQTILCLVVLANEAGILGSRRLH